MTTGQSLMALSKLNLKTSQLREGDSHGESNRHCDVHPLNVVSLSPVMCHIIPLTSVSDLITAGAGTVKCQVTRVYNYFSF